MLKRYVIRVYTETKVDGKVIDNKAGYFFEFACNKYLRTQDVVTTTFATREEAIAVSIFSSFLKSSGEQFPLPI